MELREYQRRTIERVRAFFASLTDLETRMGAAGVDADLDLAQVAWKKVVPERTYSNRQDATGRHFPSFCLKIPTGGGKTLLAVKAIDAAQTLLIRKNSGMVLWIVPSSQIYNQTLRALRDRAHPYRQHLDAASGGRTLVLEKQERFSPTDVAESLVVVLLMLPSANRQSKEQLRMFKDNGGFQDFFPAEDNRVAHAALLARVPNLETFEKSGYWGGLAKTSLGNTLALLRPVVVVDEGHKSYSESAQKTINGFNPACLIELSATPPKESNILMEISGAELEREQMIKLDLHVHNKTSPMWQDVLAAAVVQRDDLERDARAHEAVSGTYIRPICLVQAERTGKDQRESGLVHSEDIKERLMKTHSVPEEQIAIKTAEKDELGAIEDVGGLMGRDCQIRYIITKQALQEGWDCAFAYVLATLSESHSRTAMTQLVGRVLRQPYARKTGMRSLDESYVFCHRPNVAELLEDVQKGFKDEGLGDLASRIVSDDTTENSTRKLRTEKVRKEFATVARSVVLPVFAVRENGAWRPVRYEADIESAIPWEKVGVSELCALSLLEQPGADQEVLVGLPGRAVVPKKPRKNAKGVAALMDGVSIDPSFIAQHVMDIVSNPWQAHAFGREVIECLAAEHGIRLVHENHSFIVEELRKHLLAKKDFLAREVFMKKMRAAEFRFLFIGEFGALPSVQEVDESERVLLRKNAMPLQQSLFVSVPEGALNGEETKVAWYLDGQERLFFWARNRVRRDLSIQGWRKDRVWPDFVFATRNAKPKSGLQGVYVLETKGDHLIGSEDTKYKKDLLNYCTEQARKVAPKDLPAGMRVPVRFEMVPMSEWERHLNEIFS